MNWREAEKLCAWALKAKLVTDRVLQAQDIDLVNDQGQTFSVKFQQRALLTGNFSFETQMLATLTGETVPGNFTVCQATFVALLHPMAHGNRVELVVVDRAKLHALVGSRAWREVWLHPSLVRTNQEQGRKFDQAKSLLVPVHVVRDIAETVLEIQL